MDGLRRWELEWFRERFPLRWREIMSKLVFPGDPPSDDPEHIVIGAGTELEVKLFFKMESREANFLVATDYLKDGVLIPEDRSWSLWLGNVREVDEEWLADLLVDSYDVVVVMGS